MRTDKNLPSKGRKKPPFPKQRKTLKPPGLESLVKPAPKYLNSKYIGSKKLEDKVALVTGGDSGIGRAVCVLFAREGAHVAFTHLPEEASDAQKTTKLIENEGGKALAIECDFSMADSQKEVIKKVMNAFDKLDILVNNAAFQNHLDSIEQLDFDQFEHTFRVNLFAPFKLIKAALPVLKSGACIINTESILGYEGEPHLIDYAATKGALHNFTKSMANALAEKGIRVNSVAPGPVWTPLNPAERKHSEIKDFGKDTLFGRPAQPEEIAPAYVFLAAPTTASYITGETINLFGTTSGGN